MGTLLYGCKHIIKKLEKDGKNEKKLSILCSFLFILSFISISAVAIEVPDEDMNKELLLESGYNNESIEPLPNEVINDLEEKILEDPQQISISTSTMEIDTLSEIEAFYSYSDEELLSMGYDLKTIEMQKSDLEKLYNTPDNILKENYGIDSVEAKLIRKAIDSGKQAQNSIIKENGEISTSGSLSSSKITTTLTIDKSYSTSTLAKSRVVFPYNWIASYGFYSGVDKLVIAWGRGLSSSNSSTQAKFYRFSGIICWNDYLCTKGIALSESTPNAGRIYAVPQSLTENSHSGKNKCGYVSCYIYQNKTGNTADVVAYYAHRTIGVSANIGISASGPSVSVSFGSSWDVTNVRTGSAPA